MLTFPWHLWLSVLRKYSSSFYWWRTVRHTYFPLKGLFEWFVVTCTYCNKQTTSAWKHLNTGCKTKCSQDDFSKSQNSNSYTDLLSCHQLHVSILDYIIHSCILHFKNDYFLKIFFYFWYFRNWFLIYLNRPLISVKDFTTQLIGAEITCSGAWWKKCE